VLLRKVDPRCHLPSAIISLFDSLGYHHSGRFEGEEGNRLHLALCTVPPIVCGVFLYLDWDDLCTKKKAADVSISIISGLISYGLSVLYHSSTWGLY